MTMWYYVPHFKGFLQLVSDGIIYRIGILDKSDIFFSKPSLKFTGAIAPIVPALTITLVERG